MKPSRDFVALRMAVLTVSDSRTLAEDTSGDRLQALLQEAGHQLAARKLVPDDRYRLRAVVSDWIADPQVQVVMISGGTGFTGRDNTPEAILPLLDKTVDGFGELFRHISYGEIGTSTIQSRALAGLANGTLVFCMPGSTNAVQTAWNGILREQFDIRTRPCNFVQLIHRYQESPDQPAV